MFRTKDEGQKRQLLDGVHLKTLVLEVFSPVREDYLPQ